MRVIIDTNIWINYLVGKELEPITDAIFTNRIQILYSKELLEEMHAALRRPKLQSFINEQQIAKIVQLAESRGKLIDVKEVEAVCRDHKNDFLLALARYGRADYLVSGDTDLLDLIVHHDTFVCSAEFFAKRLGWPSSETLYWCSNLIKALAHPLRMEILEQLDQKGEADKESICSDMPHNRETLLAHLRVLHQANAITLDGRSRYMVNYPLIEKATKAVSKFNSSHT